MEKAPLQDPPLAAEYTGEPSPSRLMAWAEVVLAATLSLIALILAIVMTSLIGGGGIETAEDYLHMTPDFFPRLTMAILALVSARYAVGAYRAVGAASDRDVAQELSSFKRAGFMVVVAICYATSVSWLGFILATMLATLVTSYFLGLRKPLQFLPGVIVAPILIRFIVERLLLIGLARSEIEFVAEIEDAVLGFLATLLL